MFKKLCFLMCFVLVLALSGAAGAVSIDVNNPSFELRNDGNEACKSGGSMDYLLDWADGTAPGFAGRRVRCDLPSGTCGKCGDVDEPVPDGYTIGWVGINGDGYQIITDAFFEANRRYTLGLEALGWNGHGITISLFYGNNPDANELASSTFYLESEGDTVLDWTYEHVELVALAEAGAPCIGETIGIKMLGAGGGYAGTGYIYFDVVTLDKVWPTTAWDPGPEDGSDEVDKDVVLDWGPGLWVADTNGHEVYFGTSFAEVNDANTTTSGIYRGPVDSNQYDPPETLELVKTYYWRIDEVNESYSGSTPPTPPSGRWKGDVWSFEVEGRAKEPYPAHGAADVAVDVVLHWTPGRDAASHDVYFGTDEAAVSSATTLSAEFMGPQGPNTFDTANYDANGLEFAGEYFWRIDELSALTAKGATWSFSVPLYSVVEDFDGYVTTGDLRAVWDDYWVNDSGAEIGIQKLEDFVRDGNSVEYNYDNSFKSGGQYLGSWIDADIADLEIGPDWTKSGIRGLVLYSLGQGGNAGGVNNRMWVELEDTSSNTAVGIYDGNPNDVAIPEWHEWNIDLSVFDACGVSLANIDKIHLGFGGHQGKPAGAKNPGQGGTGTVWFDDIQVHPQRCVPAYSWTKGDFEGDCLIDTLDVKAVSRDWLESGGMVSASPPDANLLLGWYELEEGADQTAGNSGTLSSHDGTLGNTGGVDACDPAWITSDPCAARERCLEFDGVSEYVLIPGFNVTSNTATYTAWVKRSGDQSVYTPVFCSIDGNTPDPNDLSSIKLAGLFFGSDGEDGAGPGWNATNELTYYWRNDSWDFHTGLIVPEGLWTFIGMTIAPDEAMVYMYDGGTMSSVVNPAPHGMRLFDGVNRIGGWVNQNAKNKFVNGRIDDARFYNYTLSQGEVLYLAEPTGEFYRPLEDWRTDIDDDDTVNFVDHAYMADNWLKEILWPEP